MKIRKEALIPFGVGLIVFIIVSLLPSCAPAKSGTIEVRKIASPTATFACFVFLQDGELRGGSCSR